MKRTTALFILLFSFTAGWTQTPNLYEISFDNAVHHEARISVKFMDLEQKDLLLSMSRSSPGRYALHEFAKNVYDVKAMDENGALLQVRRPNPYQWLVSGHQGVVVFEYTLYADHADGTYSQIDLSHAHLNMPATFVFAKEYSERPIELKVHARKDLGWKVATQLKQLDNDRYFAPDLYYFLDSPLEISDHEVKHFVIHSNGKDLKINFVLHQLEESSLFDPYFEQVKKVVRQQQEIFGELPDFDFGSYTFLACYAPHVDGDGMEHRNSTVLTSRRTLENGGLKSNIGTVAHEFLHAWNVERIRPSSLEPFDFERANMSGELWFAEGFTSYYTSLTMCRAGLMSRRDYARRLAATINSVVNAPGRKYFNPVEMSYQAPFVDAATSVDPVNRENTFISYYTYGNFLGLCLDLSLRNLEGEKNLDAFMRLAWERFGKDEKPYIIKDLEDLLEEYTDPGFSKSFFQNYVWKSEVPDLKALLGSVGISLEQSNAGRPYLGATVKATSGGWLLRSNPLEGHSFYLAGLNRGDLIKFIGGTSLITVSDPSMLTGMFEPGQTVKVIYERNGKTNTTDMTWTSDPSYQTSLSMEADQEILERRNDWLEDKTSN